MTSLPILALEEVVGCFGSQFCHRHVFGWPTAYHQLCEECRKVDNVNVWARKVSLEEILTSLDLSRVHVALYLYPKFKSILGRCSLLLVLLTFYLKKKA